MENLAQIITAVAAVAAVLISPIINYKITKLKVQGDAITQNRRQWISELRTKISELNEKIYIHGLEEVKREKNETNDIMYWDTTREALTLMENIKLYLNPEQKEHHELIEALREVYQEILEDDENRNLNHGAMKEKIMRSAQPVLKDAWEQIKTDVS